MAFYFSAVYSESLYLALSVGLFWCARQGRWALGGRARRARGRHAQHRPRAAAAGADALPVRAARGPPARLRPRARTGRRRVAARDLAGRCARPAPLPAARGRPVARAAARGARPVHGLSRARRRRPARAVSRPGRLGAALRRALRAACGTASRAAFEGARQLLSVQRAHVYYPIAAGSPFVAAGHNLMLLAFLLARRAAVRRGAARAAARLRRLRDRRARAAALLPGRARSR